MSFGPRTSCSSLLVYLICIKLLRCQVLTVDRNIIKFNLTNREMSLQPPGLFAEAHDVVYFNISRGRDAAVNFQSPKETCIRFPDPPRKRGFFCGGDDLHGNAPACQRSTYLIYSTFFARRQQRCGLRFMPVLWQFVAIIAQANEVSNAALQIRRRLRGAAVGAVARARQAALGLPAPRAVGLAVTSQHRRQLGHLGDLAGHALLLLAGRRPRRLFD